MSVLIRAMVTVLIGETTLAFAVTAQAGATRSPQYFNPTWSPDGKALVYESDSSGRYAVYRVSARGGQPTLLVSSTADDMQGNLSPDGRSLAFVSNRNGNLDVFVMQLERGEVKQLTTDPGEQYQPRWSPDGHSLAFVSKPGKAARIHDVMLLDLASGVIRNLTNTPDSNELGPAWKPDGQTLVFGSNRAGGGMVLYEQDLSTGAVRNSAIQGPASSPHLSPEGATTFVSNRDGNAEVYVASPDGQRIVRVTVEPAEDWGPTLSPDGHQVAFASKRGGQWGIYVADVTGDNLRCVVGHCATR